MAPITTKPMTRAREQPVKISIKVNESGGLPRTASGVGLGEADGADVAVAAAALGTTAWLSAMAVAWPLQSGITRNSRHAAAPSRFFIFDIHSSCLHEYIMRESPFTIVQSPLIDASFSSMYNLFL